MKPLIEELNCIIAYGTSWAANSNSYSMEYLERFNTEKTESLHWYGNIQNQLYDEKLK